MPFAALLSVCIFYDGGGGGTVSSRSWLGVFVVWDMYKSRYIVARLILHTYVHTYIYG